MRKLVGLVFLVAVVLGGKYAWERVQESTQRSSAEARVRGMLAAVAAGSARGQEALCFWGTGSAVCGEDAMRMHTDAFDRWRREKGIDTLRDFRIEAVTVDRSTGSARVEVTIDGTRQTMLLRPGAPVAWAR